MAKQLQKTALTEDVAFQPVATPERDMARVKALLEQGIVENVKILGFSSPNHSSRQTRRRRYNPDGIDPAIYDRKAVNLNHPPVSDPLDQDEMHRAVASSRDVHGVFGEIQEPYKTPDGIYAKRLWFNTDHAYAKTFKNFVLNAPHRIGLSPAQFGQTYAHEGEEIVERVLEAESVDLVGKPGTTKGLLEGQQCAEGDEGMMEEDDALDAALGDEDMNLAGDGGDAETGYDAEGDQELASDEEGDLDEGGEGGKGPDVTPEMFASITKIVQAFFDKSIDKAAAMAKIKTIFRTHAAIAESVMATTVQEPKTAEEAVKLLGRLAGRVKNKAVAKALETVLLENRQARAETAQRSKREKAVALMEAAKLGDEIRTDEGFIAELLDCPTEARMQKKIELWQKIFGTRESQRPKSAAPTAMTESELAALRQADPASAPAMPTEKDREEAINRLESRYRGLAQAAAY